MFSTVMTKFNPRVFGTLLLTMIGIIIFILKIMNNYEIGRNTTLYYELNGIMLSLPIFIAIAITMIQHRLVMGYKSMIVMFVFWLIISYLIITPVVLGEFEKEITVGKHSR
jgi:hypothetical protein